MKARYEYKFVRFGEGILSARREAHNYQEYVHRSAREGWRLVQIFTPGFGAYGSPKYVELVLEREIYPQ